jgi:nitroreductase
MNIKFSIEEAVNKRYSVRNYADQVIEDELKKEIQNVVSHLENPFGPQVKFHYLEFQDGDNNEKLGTYGVIKGAKNYIGATIQNKPMALLALGYEFESLILYLASVDIGTCWLGGTFDRKGFANAMNVGDDELFPIITPYGYAAEKKHIKELAMRKMIKADQRKEWKELFYKNDFSTPLTKETAGEFAFALEMVRLGPSASNKQPWRIVLDEGIFHFYEYSTPGYSKSFSYDIQRIDMGIAAAHFDHAVKEKGFKGYFEVLEEPKIDVPKNIQYVFSWKMDSVE